MVPSIFQISPARISLHATSKKLEYKMKVTLAVLLVAALLVCSVLGGARRKRQTPQTCLHTLDTTNYYSCGANCRSDQDCSSPQRYCEIFTQEGCKPSGYGGKCVAYYPECGSLEQPIQRSAPVPVPRPVVVAQPSGGSVQPSGGYDYYDYYSN